MDTLPNGIMDVDYKPSSGASIVKRHERTSFPPNEPDTLHYKRDPVLETWIVDRPALEFKFTPGARYIDGGMSYISITLSANKPRANPLFWAGFESRLGVLALFERAELVSRDGDVIDRVDNIPVQASSLRRSQSHASWAKGAFGSIQGATTAEGMHTVTVSGDTLIDNRNPGFLGQLHTYLLPLSSILPFFAIGKLIPPHVLESATLRMYMRPLNDAISMHVPTTGLSPAESFNNKEYLLAVYETLSLGQLLYGDDTAIVSMSDVNLSLDMYLLDTGFNEMVTNQYVNSGLEFEWEQFDVIPANSYEFGILNTSFLNHVKYSHSKATRAFLKLVYVPINNRASHMFDTAIRPGPIDQNMGIDKSWQFGELQMRHGLTEFPTRILTNQQEALFICLQNDRLFNNTPNNAYNDDFALEFGSRDLMCFPLLRHTPLAMNNIALPNRSSNGYAPIKTSDGVPVDFEHPLTFRGTIRDTAPDMFDANKADAVGQYSDGTMCHMYIMIGYMRRYVAHGMSANQLYV